MNTREQQALDDRIYSMAATLSRLIAEAKMDKVPLDETTKGRLRVLARRVDNMEER